MLGHHRIRISELDSKLPKGAGEELGPWDKTDVRSGSFSAIPPSAPISFKVKAASTAYEVPRALSLHDHPLAISLWHYFLPPTHPTATTQEAHRFPVCPGLSGTVHLLVPWLRTFSRSPMTPHLLQVSVCSSRTFLKRPSLITHFKAAPGHVQSPSLAFFSASFSCVTLTTTQHMMDFTRVCVPCQWDVSATGLKFFASVWLHPQ